MILFLKMCTTPTQNDYPPIWEFCCSAPGWRFRVGDPQKMGFFSSSQNDLVLSRGSNERPLSRIRALPPTPALRAFSCYAPGWRFRVGGPRKMGLRAETNLYWKRNAFSHFRPRAHLAHSTIYRFFAHLPHQMHIFAPTYPPTSKRHGRCRKKAPGKYPPPRAAQKEPK